jgi:hypothetical protein
MAEHVITGANSNVKGAAMNTLKVSEHREIVQPQPTGLPLEARAVETDAEFRQRMVLLHREIRSDGNNADEMHETIAGVAFLVGAPLFLMLFALFAVARQDLLTKVTRALGF